MPYSSSVLTQTHGQGCNVLFFAFWKLSRRFIKRIDVFRWRKRFRKMIFKLAHVSLLCIILCPGGSVGRRYSTPLLPALPSLARRTQLYDRVAAPDRCSFNRPEAADKAVVLKHLSNLLFRSLVPGLRHIIAIPSTRKPPHLRQRHNSALLHIMSLAPIINLFLIAKRLK